MKLRTLFVFGALVTLALSSCKSDTETIVGNWLAKAYTQTTPRANGASFSINNIGYYGLGNDEDDYKSDFWKYNPETNAWTQVKTFTGTARAFCISTATETKGYVGLGYDGNIDLKDFWEYNPTTNEWTKLEDFMGGERKYATAFTIGNDIYAGTGTTLNNKSYKNDMFKFSTSTGKWTNENVAGLGGSPRSKAASFVLEGKGYIIGGFNNGSALRDFWCYDPATNKWIEKDRLNNSDTGGDTNLPRYDANTFVANGIAYIACGRNSSGTPNTNVYQWNSATDSWSIKTDFEGVSRAGANSFVLNNKGYIVGGTNGLSNFFNDMFMFMPDDAKNEND